MTAVYQPSLLEHAIMPAHNSTPTSVAAAAAAIKKVSAQKRRILAYLANEANADPKYRIQERIALALMIPLSTVNPRVNEMADDHWVEPTTETRPTTFKKAARVYQITSKGREVLEASEGNGDGHPVGAKG